MFNRSVDWFRDVTRFCIFLSAYQAFLATGYGQDQSAQNLAPARLAPPPLGNKPNPGNPLAAKPVVTSKLQPLAQVPDFRAVISVGHSQSALTVGAVTNDTLTITYSVFNLRGDPVNGVLLTTTLQSGVTFQSAVPMPDRSGQQLIFSLGSLPPLGSATAQLTVTLANSSTTQIDGGATAFAYWNGRPVQSTALAAVLRTTPVNTNLLVSTINANLNDTYITGEAATLGNDPNRIFQFVRDQVGYESYPGALRGARGTLWSMAGNSLDKASLLVALLRASGIPAQYATGTLSLALQKQLILSMFPAQTKLTGYVATGATLSDPADDPKLQAEAATHYWVQFDNGTGTLVNADPDFAGAAIGQTFTTAQSAFIDVASNLNQMVTVKLNVEMYQQGFFGPITSTITPLTQTFTSAELVGHPLTLGHLVQSQTAGFVLSATTNSYTPYLIVGQNDPTPSDDPTIMGQPYQEALTNFPFGSQILTGVFLEMDTGDPSGNTTTNTHTILDRIGYAARQGLAQASVSLPANGQPAISPLDNVTIGVESSDTDARVAQALVVRDGQITQNLQQLTNGVSPSNPTPSQAQALASAGPERMISLTQATSAAFAVVSSLLRRQLASNTVTASYLDSPRITVDSASAQQNGQSTKVSLSFDLRKNNLRSQAAPGQDVTSTIAFQSSWGFAEAALESTLFSGLAGQNGQTTVSTQSVVDVMQAASQQGIPLNRIDATNVGSLDAANYSADAKAYITQAVENGRVVAVPAQSVALNGQNTVAWWEFNPITGETIDTSEDGGHQEIEEFIATLALTVPLGVAVAVAAINMPGGFAAVFLATFLIALVGIALTGGALVAGGLLLGLGLAGIIRLILQAAAEGLQALLALANSLFDPPVPPILSGSGPFVAPSAGSKSFQRSGSLSAGNVQGTIQAASVRATNQIAAAWSSTAISSFQAGMLNASNATVKNNGQTVGTGAVTLNASTPVASAISGNVNYSVNGTGDLSFYGPATSAIGASGNWTSYSATLTGSPSVQISTNGLLLNGNPLPQGTYTIMASSITMSGSGTSTTPNFAGSASLNVTAGSVYLGPGSGTFTSDGTPLSPTNGITLDGFNGTISITGNGSTDSAAINGNASNVLAVTPNPSSFTTNENTPVTFSTALATSLADTYSIIAEAPPGWTVSMDTSGNVTATLAAGLQSGTFPVFVTAVSGTDRNLVAQAAVLITLGATQPGVTLSVATDAMFTVPVNGAQLPSAFRASIQNIGPASDTFNVAVTGVPAGFTILDSATSFVIPPGSVAVDGLYLSPTGQLPAPGTQVSFTVTATSATNSAITASQLVSFTVLAIQALTLSPSPATFSTTPGTAVMSTLTLQSAGNIPVTATLSSVTDPNLTLNGLAPSTTLGVGQSSTESLTITPGANAPLTRL
jgi:transglutaminase-like putative cysteine protease